MRPHLEARDDGWHEWVADDGLDVHVRLDEQEDGRIHVVALHVEGVLSAEMLRRIPIGRIEALANSVATRQPASRKPPSARLPDQLLRAGARSRPDAFYEQVAVRYRYLVSATPSPVLELAVANEVPRTTAHRWVKEARRRGLLPPGRPGKAG
jgi:hypothetical protein